MKQNDWISLCKAIAIRLALFTAAAFCFFRASVTMMLLGGTGFLVLLMFYRARKE